MLAVTTKYAIKALQHLAKQDSRHFMQVNALSQAIEVPGPYLAKIVKALAARGVVETRRGFSGGVRLSPREGTLTYYDICIALDDPVVISSCLLSKESCNSQDPCPIHVEWRKTKELLVKFLQKARVVT
jgi:Rrf2 family iron-sulfur cluster assembly transcriptional regulator